MGWSDLTQFVNTAKHEAHTYVDGAKEKAEMLSKIQNQVHSTIHDVDETAKTVTRSVSTTTKHAKAVMDTAQQAMERAATAMEDTSHNAVDEFGRAIDTVQASITNLESQVSRALRVTEILTGALVVFVIYEVSLGLGVSRR